MRILLLLLAKNTFSFSSDSQTHSVFILLLCMFVGFGLQIEMQVLGSPLSILIEFKIQRTAIVCNFSATYRYLHG